MFLRWTAGIVISERPSRSAGRCDTLEGGRFGRGWCHLLKHRPQLVPQGDFVVEEERLAQ